MKILLSGSRWVLGDNVDTDTLFPGRYMTIKGATADVALRGLAELHPEMARRFAVGDAIVAGHNFGCGSSREYAATALRDLGVALVIATSFARIFYRNAFNVGLPLLEYPGSAPVPADGDLAVELAAGTITHVPTGEVRHGTPVAPLLLDLLTDGGLMPRLRRWSDARRSDEDFDVLHTVVIKGMVAVPAVATALAWSEERARAALDGLVAGGLATFHTGRDVWRATEPGRRRHAELVARDMPAATAARLRPIYAAFLPVNVRFKQLCARWQLRDGAMNDHTDQGYDAAVLADLDRSHTEAVSLVGAMARVQPRYGRYGGRLDGALARVRSGDLAAFTGVRRDSYHDVWMELHRDLLLSLGIDRSTEDPA